MITKYRLTNYFLILASLILGISLVACGTTAAAVEDVEPASVDIIDDGVTEPTIEPTATPEPEETAVINPDEAAIQAALGTHLGVDASTLTVFVEANSGTYARGGVDNGYFLAAKVNGSWVIVADGQGVIDCNVVAQYGFPTSLVPECAEPLSDEAAIRSALGAHLGVDPNTLTIVVETSTGSHVRGGVDNGYFLAAKINGDWVIVAEGQGVIDCNVLAQYGFPGSMTPECPIE